MLTTIERKMTNRDRLYLLKAITMGDRCKHWLAAYSEGYSRATCCGPSFYVRDYHKINSDFDENYRKGLAIDVCLYNDFDDEIFKFYLTKSWDDLSYDTKKDEVFLSDKQLARLDKILIDAVDCQREFFDELSKKLKKRQEKIGD